MENPYTSPSPSRFLDFASGGASVLTCNCSITAIALLIDGLIVLMDNSVKQAFELARQGYLPEQIDALFNPWATPGKLPNPAGPPFA